MKRTVLIAFTFLALFSIAGLANQVIGQKTVEIQQVKELKDANEFVLSWKGGDYKTLYYELHDILDVQPNVQRQVFVWKLKQISAIVSKNWGMDDLITLFESHGYVALDKTQ